MKFDLRGVTVATVLPFHDNGEIDWDSYRNCLEYCTTPAGISGVFVNGHAGEGATLSQAERRRVIEVTRDFIGKDKPIFAGLIAYGTDAAVAEARLALDAGADILVVFPPPGLAAGGAAAPAAPLAHVHAIATAVDAPLSIFQYPLGSGCGYTTETLVEMAKIPNVVAIKEGSDTMTAYEDTWRAVKKVRPEVSILPSNYDWFLAQMAVGGDGILSGLASLTPHLLVDLWKASEAGDLARMRDVGERLYPIVRNIYGRSPRMDMHTRIKVALAHFGLIRSARPRGPLLPVDATVATDVIAMVEAAGLGALMKDGPTRKNA